MRNANIFFKEKEKIKYNYLLDIGGIDIIDLIIEKKNNVNGTHLYLIKIIKYLNLILKEDIREVLVWLVENKQQYQVRKALEAKISKKLLMRLIKENKSLKGNFFN
jgi:hypothetical protein